eukprot:49431-Chlamydomonas_euryale.AAC.1
MRGAHEKGRGVGGGRCGRKGWRRAGGGRVEGSERTSMDAFVGQEMRGWAGWMGKGGARGGAQGMDV